MKIRLLALIILICAFNVSAQKKDNYFAAIGINSPGISVAWDKKMLSHLDLGLGLNLNKTDDQYNNIRAGAYVDIRPYFLWRKNLLFIPVNLGWSIYSGKEPKDASISNSGLYSSLGVGYAYLITKRGMGPFVSFTFNGYTEHYHLNNPNLRPEAKDYGLYNGSLQMNLGFKF